MSFKAVFCGALLLLPLTSVQAADGHWAKIADQVIAAIGQGEVLAKAGKPEEAKSAIVDAYFDVFEEFKMEKALRLQMGMERTTAVEGMFEALENEAGTPGAAKVHVLAEKLRKALRDDAAKLDKARVAADGAGKE